MKTYKITKKGSHEFLLYIDAVCKKHALIKFKDITEENWDGNVYTIEQEAE